MPTISQIKWSGRRIRKQLYDKVVSVVPVEVLILITKPLAENAPKTQKAKFTAWCGEYGFYMTPKNGDPFHLTIFPHTKHMERLLDWARKVGLFHADSTVERKTINMNLTRLEAIYADESPEGLMKVFMGLRHVWKYRDDESNQDFVVRKGWRDVVDPTEVLPAVKRVKEVAPHSSDKVKVKVVKESK